MGLIVLILVGIVPTAFALNMSTDQRRWTRSAPVRWCWSSDSPPADGAGEPLDAAHKTLTNYLRHGTSEPETLTALGANAAW